jgi:hypothetical protein
MTRGDGVAGGHRFMHRLVHHHMPALGRIAAAALLLVAAAAPRPAAAQFLDDASVTAAGGPSLGDVRTQRYRVGVLVTAAGGRCREIRATMPVPDSWPEQQVRIVEEEVSPEVRGVAYRPLAPGVRQLTISIPDLAAGRSARVLVTFELDRAAILPPTDTAGLRIPEKPDRDLRAYLGTSPYIESRHPRIVKFARESAEGREGWDQVEAIYDAVRERVEYRNGALKGAARALADGWGDCEELTCLFIAAARAQGIPARTVWVEGHCYPEFYLVDTTGNGWWFPCQAAGTRAFGGMPDQLPILQKGDNFRDPDRPGKSLRYVSEFITGSSVGGGAAPTVEWIREGG